MTMSVVSLCAYRISRLEPSISNALNGRTMHPLNRILDLRG